MTPPRCISLLTDYGEGSLHAGVCRALVLGLAPSVALLELSHAVPPFNVRAGAVMLERLIAFAPVGVHVAVVDPGVGSRRRAIALTVGERIFVGPDNGLLIAAAEACGQIEVVVELSDHRFWRSSGSLTFDGRDIFIPVAVFLATGASLSDMGPTIPLDSLVRLAPPIARVIDGTTDAEVLAVDAFGNVQLAIDGASASEAGFVRGAFMTLNSGQVAEIVGTFSEIAAGQVGCFVDSDGYLSLAVNRGSAAHLLGLALGDTVRFEHRR